METKTTLLTILICLIPLTAFAQQEDIIKTVDDSWTDGSSFSVWKDGAFDLTNVESLRITFPSLQAGVKFYVRLLPEGIRPDLPIGLSRKFHTIPQDGVVIVPISEFEFSKVQLSNISQISIHSGISAWHCPLNQGPMSHAVFEKIELIK